MPDPSATISEYYGLEFVNYCIYSSAVLVVCEYFSSFPQEVNLFWKRKFTGAAFLFYFNRYLFLVYSLIRFPGTAVTWNLTTRDWSKSANLITSRCSDLTRLEFAMNITGYIIWAAFSGLRGYAVSGKWYFGLLIFCLSSVTPGVNLPRFYFGVSGINVPLIGCVFSSSMGSTYRDSATIASRTGLITSDCLLIFFTWWRLQGCRTKNTELQGKSFAHVLRRDGTAYFAALLLMNSLQLTLTMLSLQPGLQGSSYATLFAEPITSILVSRFLLDLQSVNQDDMTHSSLDTQGTNASGAENSPQTHSLVFNRILGSIATSSQDYEAKSVEDMMLYEHILEEKETVHDAAYVEESLEELEA